MSFKTLKNEAVIYVDLKTNGPLLINAGTSGKIDPTKPDMSFVRTKKDGIETVYMPGSSIKGVFRSRYEQVMLATGFSKPDICNITDKKNNCSEKIKDYKKRNHLYNLSGKEIYEKSCEACKLFGNLSIASRIVFFDAYPKKDTEPKLSMRYGIAIDRASGATKSGALFDTEVIEEGTFSLKIKLTNFELYQLRMIFNILQDIDDGMLAFGMGGTRGNGQMKICNPDSTVLKYRSYPNDDISPKEFILKLTNSNEILYNSGHIEGFENILSTISKDCINDIAHVGNTN